MKAVSIFGKQDVCFFSEIFLCRGQKEGICHVPYVIGVGPVSRYEEINMVGLSQNREGDRG
jgi:hypothetical protein